MLTTRPCAACAWSSRVRYRDLFLIGRDRTFCIDIFQQVLTEACWYAAESATMLKVDSCSASRVEFGSSMGIFGCGA